MCSPSAESRRSFVAPLDPATYRRHPIHGDGRTWAETNCYTDLLVELVHAMGHEPVACLAFTLAIDFEGDQWTFFKPPHAELMQLYGLDIQELAIWRPMRDHVVEQVERGNPVLVEVDSFYLPDTAGTAYQLTHAKTTVGVNEIDVALRRMGYFHNAGYFVVQGEDFDRLFDIRGLPPYVEFVKRNEARALRDAALVEASLGLLRSHLARAPKANPFPVFRERFGQDLGWLLQAPIEAFHAYSFATLRQYGACFELAETYLRWLAGHGVEGVEEPAAALHDIAGTAKAFQFQLARSMARRKPLDLAPVDAMDARWNAAMTALRERFA
jgi:Domain of unknown function (DUF1839)